MATPKIEVVADGLQFPEGPIWMKDGSVILVEISGGQLTRITSHGAKTVVAKTGGGPNGAAIGPDGKIYVCNNGAHVRPVAFDIPNGNITLEAGPGGPEPGRIERVDIATGKVERLYTECDGIPLSAPNDIVFDSDGGFWFSDLGKITATSHDHGGIFYARPDGSKIIRAVGHMNCNGIGLSPDGKTLYVAITDGRQILAFDKLGPGKLSPVGNFYSGRIVASLPGRQLLDSMAVMADGRIAQAVIWENSGIAIVDPKDGSVEHLNFPDGFTTNICFGGADMRDAWVTQSEKGKLVKVRFDEPGLKLAHYA